MAENNVRFIQCTSDEYKSTPPSGNALYFITDTCEIYKGLSRYASGDSQYRYYDNFSKAVTDIGVYEEGSSSLQTGTTCISDIFTDTVILLADTQLTADVVITKSINIDLNGMKLSSTNILSCKTADVDIKIYSSAPGASITTINTKPFINFANGRNINVENITVNCSGASPALSYTIGAMAFNTTGEVKISNCNIFADCKDSPAICILVAKGTKCSIEDCNIDIISTATDKMSKAIEIGKNFTGGSTISNCNISLDTISGTSYKISILGSSSFNCDNCKIIHKLDIPEDEVNRTIYEIAVSKTVSNCIINSTQIDVISPSNFSGKTSITGIYTQSSNSKISNCNIKVPLGVNTDDIALGVGINVNQGTISIDDSTVTGGNNGIQTNYNTKVKITNSTLMSCVHGGVYVGTGSEGNFEMQNTKCICLYHENYGQLGASYFSVYNSVSTGDWSVSLYNCDFINEGRSNLKSSAGIVGSSYGERNSPNILLSSCRVFAPGVALRTDDKSMTLEGNTVFLSYNNYENIGTIIDNRTWIPHEPKLPIIPIEVPNDLHIGLQIDEGSMVLDLFNGGGPHCAAFMKLINDKLTEENIPEVQKVTCSIDKEISIRNITDNPDELIIPKGYPIGAEIVKGVSTHLYINFDGKVLEIASNLSNNTIVRYFVDSTEDKTLYWKTL